MAIHFDALPNTNPLANVLIPEGRYTATISKAEMRLSKTDATKPPYLSITWDLKDEAGNNKGKLFDIITEPTASFTQYKLKRFIVALGLPITGEFELKDLTKIIIGKSCKLDVAIDTKSEPHRNQVEAFKGEIYYPLNATVATPEPATTTEVAPEADFPVADEDMPWENGNAPTINATDAEPTGDANAEATAPESNY